MQVIRKGKCETLINIMLTKYPHNVYFIGENYKENKQMLLFVVAGIAHSFKGWGLLLEKR